MRGSKYRGARASVRLLLVAAAAVSLALGSTAAPAAATAPSPRPSVVATSTPTPHHTPKTAPHGSGSVVPDHSPSELIGGTPAPISTKDAPQFSAALAVTYTVAGHVYFGSTSTPAAGVAVIFDPAEGGQEYSGYTNSLGEIAIDAEHPNQLVQLRNDDYTMQIVSANPHYLSNYTVPTETGVTCVTIPECTFEVNGANLTGVDATIPLGASVSGTVTYDGGGVAAGVTVYADEFDSTSGNYLGYTDTTTASDGTYTIGGFPAIDVEIDFAPPGTTYAIQSYDDYSIYYIPDYLNMTPGTYLTGINASLHRAGTVIGSVVYSAPPPMPNAYYTPSDFKNDPKAVEVEVYDGETDTWVETGDYYDIDFTQGPTYTSGTYSYTIPGLAPDYYKLLFLLQDPSLTGSFESPVIHVTGGSSANYSLTQHLTPIPTPTEVVDSIVATPGTLTVNGWGLDPTDLTDPVSVEVITEAAPNVFAPGAEVTANLDYPGFGAAFPGAGDDHGYTAQLTGLPANTNYTVCATVRSVDGLRGMPYICRSAKVPGGPPIGSIDSVTAASGAISASGWMLDPDTISPITVGVTLDGVAQTPVTANGTKAGLDAAFPGYGDGHGYTVSLAGVSGGAHTVCFTGTNIGTGSNNIPQCRVVTVPSGTPFGVFDSVTAAPATIAASGWMIDPDSTGPIDVAVTLDGVAQTSIAATGAKTGLGAAFPGFGDDHGFAINLSGVSGGSHVLCVSGLNTGPGTDSLPMCRTIAVPTGSPFGVIDTATVAPGSIALSGWMLDPDSTGPVTVNVTLDGTADGTVVANGVKTGFNASFPGYGDDHGYTVNLSSVPGGKHTVCLTGVNIGSGSNGAPICRAITVPSGSPFGVIDTLTATAATISVTGWMIDPDTTAPVSVSVIVDGSAVPVTASVAKAGLGAAFPGYGDDHGYTATVPASGGAHQVCIVGVNVAAGSNSAAMCRTIVVPSGSPVAFVDSAGETLGAITVQGWALDPDTTGAIDVGVTLDGEAQQSVTANGAKTGLAAAFPGYGDDHGFTVSLTGVSAGTHTVCVYGINVSAGSNSVPICRTLAAPTGSPFGVIDSLTSSAGNLTVTGWMLDPDTASAILVNVRIDGTVTSQFAASGTKAGLGAAFPGYGDGHGYSYTTVAPATAGNHQVCVQGVNVGGGSNGAWVCQTIVVPPTS
jgi:hypothetical protein